MGLERETGGSEMFCATARVRRRASERRKGGRTYDDVSAMRSSSSSSSSSSRASLASEMTSVGCGVGVHAPKTRLRFDAILDRTALAPSWCSSRISYEDCTGLSGDERVRTAGEERRTDLRTLRGSWGKMGDEGGNELVSLVLAPVSLVRCARRRRYGIRTRERRGRSTRGGGGGARYRIQYRTQTVRVCDEFCWSKEIARDAREAPWTLGVSSQRMKWSSAPPSGKLVIRQRTQRTSHVRGR
jgi:hypothetical protein